MTHGMVTHSVRPEPVEGLLFFLGRIKKGKGFDKLSPNGSGGQG